MKAGLANLPPGCVEPEVFWSLDCEKRKQYRADVKTRIGVVPGRYLQPTNDNCQVIAEATRRRESGSSYSPELTYPDKRYGSALRPEPDGKKNQDKKK